MGVSVALVVVVAMLAAVTLVAGSARSGRNEDRQAVDPSQDARDQAARTRPLSGRWAHHVGRHPVRYALGSFVALCAIALPALSLRIGTPDDGNAATHTTQRKAYDALADGFGPGFNGPIQVVIDIPTSADRVAVARVRNALQADAGVAAVTEPVFNAAGDTALLIANPTTAPQDAKTDALVHHLRSDVLPGTVAGTNAKALLTGQAMITDVTAAHHRPAAALHRRQSWRCRSSC